MENRQSKLAKTIMIQGTGSFVGKSVIVAALCRIFKQEGYRVTPFKSQNMSLNSYIAAGNKEISRAQAVQAEAAGIEPTVHMNPILLKPNGCHSQVVLLGKPFGNLSACEYEKNKHKFWLKAKNCLEKLRKEYDIVVMEGAGSPAEINIPNDICNMKVAITADSPVIIVGDIDRGGIFASLIGTIELLSKPERRLIKGFIINKFRGDESILKPGLRFLQEKTGIPVLGVIPYSSSLFLPQEDSQSLDEVLPGGNKIIEIVVVRLPHIANFTDFEKLAHEPAVNLRYLNKPQDLEGIDLLIIPGSKNTIADLEFLRTNGWVLKINEIIANKIPVLAICAGFQMMGKLIKDSEHLESEEKEVEGLGLLDITTVYKTSKQTYRVEAIPSSNITSFGVHPSSVIKGYEVHFGRTVYGPSSIPAFRIVKRGNRAVSVNDGAIDVEKGILGTYIHDLLENDCFRRFLLANLFRKRGLQKPEYVEFETKEQLYDRLANLVRERIDLKYIFELLNLNEPNKYYSHMLGK